MKRLFISFSILFLTFALIAQTGCTDPQANNYDSNAVENDGSCAYDETHYSIEFQTQLAPQLEEISAMIEFQGKYYGLTDSNNPNVLYQFDPLNGSILKTIELKGTTNVDWESITFDGEYIYVGDTGNNKDGNRQDLVIYKFPATDLNGASIPKDHIERLQYHYIDQTDFSEQPKLNIRYDCEAILARGDSLYLFTKDWKKFKTRYYTIPKTPTGDYAAQLKDSLNVQGLVTAATYHGDSIVVLLGSKLTGNHFLELLFDFRDNQLFSGNTRQIYINHDELKQPESLVLKKDLSGLIASESKFDSKQSLFKFSIKYWLDGNVALQDIFNTNPPLTIFPNPAKSGRIMITIPSELRNKPIQLFWFNPAGKQLSKQEFVESNFAKFTIPKNASSGIHYLLMQGKQMQFVGKITIAQ